MPVFVTGGTGYVGRSVVRALRARTHAVRALARSNAAERTLRELGAEPVRGDLRDLDLLRREAAHADALVYAAFERSGETVAVERAALEALLDATPPGRAFLYTSGVWIYGSRGDASIDESSPLAPLEIAAFRPAHEGLVLAQDGRLRASVIRPGIVYGDGGGIVGAMVEQARDGSLRIVGDGANRWPTVRHDALGELYGRIVDDRRAHGIYNATRGASVPYAEIAAAASRAAGGDGDVAAISLDEARATMGVLADAFACDLNVDSGKAARELGWEPHRPTLLEELSATTVI
ncbi:MAG TPA: NAD-dependent epimerase/dehydratase family protein [Candidatus Baltobacteraceae bacterium]|nr:NAD-dependent epimerase/dehydratase family protein [Candidatus Baltobacteraceae bacterium]